MNTKTIVSGFVGLVVVLGALLWGTHQVSPTVTVQTTSQKQFGAVTAPDIQSHWLRQGGLTTWSFESQIPIAGSATSTVCAIQSPAATTTLVAANLQVLTQPYATVWDIYWAALIATKTTLLAHGNSLSAAPLVATTSATALTDGVVNPSTWINFSVSTTTTVNANFNPTGTCSAVFRQL